VAADELLESGKWINQQIEAHTSLQAYMDLIPDDVELPAVRYVSTFPHDTRVIGSNPRVLTKVDWLVVVINRGHSVAALVPLVNAVDAALENQSGSTTAAIILACQRLNPFALMETDRTGAIFRHAGGVYRTTVQAA
jgi:hypothetical protein